MTEPLVSVIMPVFNAEKFIRQSIQSVLDQTHTNWELLITNDGSVDSSVSIINSFSDNRIHLFSQSNKGVSVARNEALAKMKGVYFTFLDADDLLPSNSLKQRVLFAEAHHNIDFIAGKVAFFNDKGIKKIWSPHFKGDPLQAFIRIDERAFCNPSLFIRRYAHLSYRFREGMTHVEDLLFFASIAQQKKSCFDYIDDIVYEYRVSNSSAMNNLIGLEMGYWMFYNSVKNFGDALPANINYLKKRIIRIMFLSYLDAGNWTNAMKMIPKIFTK